MVKAVKVIRKAQSMVSTCKSPKKPIIELIEMGNKYYDERKPWIQKRENIEEFNNTIYTCTNIIANLSNLIEPIMPQTSKRLREYLKIERPLWKQIQIKEKISLGNIEIFFERIDINKNR